MTKMAQHMFCLGSGLNTEVICSHTARLKPWKEIKKNESENGILLLELQSQKAQVEIR
jgi:hypothetical protein